MTAKGTKSIIGAVIVILLLMVAGVIIFFTTRTSQQQLSTSNASGLLGQLHYNFGSVTTALRPDLEFLFDTDCDISYITESDLNTLDSLGFKIEKTVYPVLSHNSDGDLELSTTRYTVQLPIYKWTVTTDSVGENTYKCDFSSINVIENVDFAPSTTGVSVLGADFIEKFCVAIPTSNDIISLYLDVPRGYESISDMDHSFKLKNTITPGHRYYFPMTVDFDFNYYIVDTGIKSAFVKRPANELTPNGHNLSREKIISNNDTLSAIVDPDGWLAIGNREGKARISYYDSQDETHAINPLNISCVGMLIDFPGEKIWLQKGSKNHTEF